MFSKSRLQVKIIFLVKFTLTKTAIEENSLLNVKTILRKVTLFDDVEIGKTGKLYNSSLGNYEKQFVGRQKLREDEILR